MDKNLMAQGHVFWRPAVLRRLALGLFLLALAPLAARAQQPWWKTNMELVGDLAVGNPIDLDVAGSRAYLKCSSAPNFIEYLVVANITNPQKPSVTGVWYPPEHLQDVAAVGNSVICRYINSPTVLHIFDLTDPNTAKELKTIDLGVPINHIATTGNLAVVTSYISDSSKPHLQFTILDLSNPAALKTLSQQQVAIGISSS